MPFRSRQMLVLLVTTLCCSGAWAAPYDNLATALRQQLLINDLRTQCRIPQQVSDEKIKGTFLASAENHQNLLAAADALRMNDREKYQQQLATIQCPNIS